MHEFGPAQAAPTSDVVAPRPPRRERTLQRSDSLPRHVGAAIEHLSGLSMDDVRVHRNSSAPASVDAHAFTTGREIHVAPGQEHRVAHEAWHVVQQAQGRVRPSTSLAGRALNRDPGLEEEADRMGTRASRIRPTTDRPELRPLPSATPGVTQLDANDASAFIAEHEIPWTGGVTKKKVTEYAKDESNSATLRDGLVAAWNKGANPGQLIKISSAAAKLGGQSKTAEKADEAATEKASGDDVLARALDLYDATSAVGVVDCEGFRLCGFRGGVAVAVSRVSSKAEASSMKKEQGISRRAHADPYKWFSEAVAHTDAFQNASSGGSNAKIIVWLHGDRYRAIRASIEHEASSSGLAQNRFHREGIKAPFLINIGIHEAEEATFNAAMIKATDLVPGGATANKLTLREKKDSKPKRTPPPITNALVEEIASSDDERGVPMTNGPGATATQGAVPVDVPSVRGQEFLFARTIGFDSVLAWRASAAYQLYVAACGTDPDVPSDQIRALLDAMRDTVAT